MLITVWGAYQGHYDKEFQLTMSQRTLMLQTISYFVYLLSGAAIYAHIENWSYLDAVYWADFTLLTVGIGDYAPITHLGRGLLFPFAIGGIIILGLVIGSIRSLVLERVGVKMGARMVEKERRRLLKKLETKNRSSILEPITHDGLEDLATGDNISRTSTLTRPQTPKTQQMTERARREREFQLMRNIQEQAHIKRRWTSLIVSSSVWFFLWFVGGMYSSSFPSDCGRTDESLPLHNVNCTDKQSTRFLTHGIVWLSSTELVILRIPLLLIHLPPDHRLWRHLPHLTSRQVLLCLLVPARRALPHNPNLQHGRHNR